MEKVLVLIFVLMATFGVGISGLVIYENTLFMIPSMIVSAYLIFSILAKDPYNKLKEIDQLAVGISIIIFFTTLIFLLVISHTSGLGDVAISKEFGRTEITYIVKEKFQSVANCGLVESGTSYSILSTDGRVIEIAKTCGGSTNHLKYYNVWSDADPGDTVIQNQLAIDLFVLRKTGWKMSDHFWWWNYV